MKRTAALFALLVLSLVALVPFRRRLLALLLRLPPPRYTVRVHTGLRIPMRDGMSLAADHYAPESADLLPTLLIRSPYGRDVRAGVFGALLAVYAHLFAERGYHVLVQDTRGCFDSDGQFSPYFNEQVDGLATLDWLKAQTWHRGPVGTWGPSYLGIVQWAMAAHTPDIQALVPIVTTANLHDVLYPDGALDLGLALRWPVIFQQLDRTRSHPYLSLPLQAFHMERGTSRGFRQTALADADRAALGQPVEFYQEWLRHTDSDDALWQQVHDEIQLTTVQRPIHLIGGWYDFFLRAQLRDYAALRAAGRHPYLTIGPWHHFNGMLSPTGLREGLIWFEAQLKGYTARLRTKPVRIFVLGTRQWREYDSWPPSAQTTPYYLHSDGRLDALQPGNADPPDCYAYDPANPTPALGGNQFSPWAGAKDNQRLEARADVLSFTTPPLGEALEVIGAVRTVLYVRSSRAYTDFFARLCDVHPDGRSFNICDGLFRITPDKAELQLDGTLKIEVDMWATACRFKAGHRLRLQVSSGAHPRWARNPGCADSFAPDALYPAAQTLYHDAEHPSALLLPVAVR